MAPALQLAVLCAALPVASAACPAADWLPYRDKCYWMSSFALEWRSVEQVCALAFPGSEPVSVHDAEMNAFLSEAVAGVDNLAWLGLRGSRSADDWAWSDGTPLDWSFWDSGEPSSEWEGCAFLNCGPHGEWCSTDCGSSYTYFMCQINNGTESIGN